MTAAQSTTLATEVVFKLARPCVALLKRSGQKVVFGWTSFAALRALVWALATIWAASLPSSITGSIGANFLGIASDWHFSPSLLKPWRVTLHDACPSLESFFQENKDDGCLLGFGLSDPSVCPSVERGAQAYHMPLLQRNSLVSGIAC